MEVNSFAKRKIPRYLAEVIAYFQARIDKVKPFMEQILAMELEERELNAAQAQLAKAESLALRGGAETPAARPKRRNWFSERRDAKRAGKSRVSHLVSLGSYEELVLTTFL